MSKTSRQQEPTTAYWAPPEYWARMEAEAAARYAEFDAWHAEQPRQVCAHGVESPDHCSVCWDALPADCRGLRD